MRLSKCNVTVQLQGTNCGFPHLVIYVIYLAPDSCAAWWGSERAGTAGGMEMTSCAVFVCAEGPREKGKDVMGRWILGASLKSFRAAIVAAANDGEIN